MSFKLAVTAISDANIGIYQKIILCWAKGAVTNIKAIFFMS